MKTLQKCLGRNSIQAAPVKINRSQKLYGPSKKFQGFWIFSRGNYAGLEIEILKFVDSHFNTIT